jgi:hypothetical protein
MVLVAAAMIFFGENFSRPQYNDAGEKLNIYSLSPYYVLTEFIRNKYDKEKQYGREKLL